MHWKPLEIDKLEKKYPNRSAHVAWGAVLVFLVSRLGLHPGTALVASILAGLAWEWGYAWVKSWGPEKLSEALIRYLGWPKLGPRTYVTVEKATAKTAPQPLYSPAQLGACGKAKATSWTLEIVLWRGGQACNRNNPSLIDWLAWIIGGVAAGAVLVFA